MQSGDHRAEYGINPERVEQNINRDKMLAKKYKTFNPRSPMELSYDLPFAVSWSARFLKKLEFLGFFFIF